MGSANHKRDTGFGPRAWSAELALFDDSVSKLRTALEEIECKAQDINDPAERRQALKLLKQQTDYFLTLVVNLASC